MADQEQFELLYQAFQRADRDQDSRLNQHEFMEFCETGLGKPQQDEQMYMALCTQLGLDPIRGVQWQDISVMFAASNSQPEDYPPEVASPAPDHYRGSSMSHSYENARHDRNPSVQSLDDYDDMSQTSETTRPLSHHRSTSSMKRDSSMAELAIIEALQSSNEAQSKKLKEMSKKVKHVNKKNASLERDKKNLQDQLQHSNQQLDGLQRSMQTLEREKADLNQRLTSERNRYEEKIRLIQNQLEDDRKTITHLEGQHVQAQQERDQVLQLFKNAETQMDQQLTTIKRKHKEQLEKVSVGFLQSLGAQPGEDIRQIVRDLRNEKQQLTQQVSMLAEQLTRKDRSLYEALQAIDALSIQQKMVMRGNAGGTGRRPSTSAAAGMGTAGAANPETPGDEYKSRFDRHTDAEFFIHAMDGSPAERGNPGTSRRLSGPSALGGVSASRSNAHKPLGPEGQVKQYEFVANAMVAQVAEKEEQIENLLAANEVLGRQINQQRS